MLAARPARLIYTKKDQITTLLKTLINGLGSRRERPNVLLSSCHPSKLEPVRFPRGDTVNRMLDVRLSFMIMITTFFDPIPPISYSYKAQKR
jgi:hypothetical protein